MTVTMTLGPGQKAKCIRVFRYTTFGDCSLNGVTSESCLSVQQSVHSFDRLSINFELFFKSILTKNALENLCNTVTLTQGQNHRPKGQGQK